jgi:hypothetical protein
VRYELDFYIPEFGIIHSHRRENLTSFLGEVTKCLKVAKGHNAGIQSCDTRGHKTISYNILSPKSEATMIANQGQGQGELIQ